jgi:hypothetical protein
MNKRFKVGDKVKSNYRNCWHGIIIAELECIDFSHKKCNYIYNVIPIIDSKGNFQRKLTIHQLSGRWLELSLLNFEKPDKFDEIVLQLRKHN